jgi:hypothetical protein
MPILISCPAADVVFSPSEVNETNMSRPYKPVRMVTDQQLSTEGASSTSTEQPRAEIRHRQLSTKNRNSHTNSKHYEHLVQVLSMATVSLKILCAC